MWSAETTVIVRKKVIVKIEKQGGQIYDSAYKRKYLPSQVGVKFSI